MPEKVTFANDDRSIRPFVLIKTESDDYTQISKVQKVYFALIDLTNAQIVHINEQRLQGTIKVNYKTVSRYFKLVMSSNIRYGKRGIDDFLDQKY